MYYLYYKYPTKNYSSVYRTSILFPKVLDRANEAHKKEEKAATSK